MTSLRSTLLLAILLMAPSVVGATELRSEFGFTAQVPDGWFILSRDELKQNGDLLEELFSSPELAGVDPSMVRRVEQVIRSGQAELLFRESLDDGFASNVNIIEQTGRLPEEEEIERFCLAIGEQLQKAAGRPIEVFACRIADGLPFHAVYLDFEGMVAATRSVQYLIRKSKGVHIIATATASDDSIGAVRAELDSIVASLRFE